MKLRDISWAVVVLIAGMFTQALSGPQSQQPIDVSKLGPQVGQQAPDFSLKDQTGKTWSLQSMMGPKGAMLVFVRSADW